MEEVAGIKEAFEVMDTGKRGKINLEELRMGLQKLGQQIPDADLQILVEAVRLFVPDPKILLSIPPDLGTNDMTNATDIFEVLYCL